MGMDVFAYHADLHFVLTQMPGNLKERNRILSDIKELHHKMKESKLVLRTAARIELEFRAGLRDSLAKAELSEIASEGRVENPVVETVREQAVEAKLAAIETTNAKSNHEG